LENFFSQPDLERAEALLPEYCPYLGGCRYTLEQMTASFTGVHLETSRDDLLMSVIRGNAAYQGTHWMKSLR